MAAIGREIGIHFKLMAPSRVEVCSTIFVLLSSSLLCDILGRAVKATLNLEPYRSMWQISLDLGEKSIFLLLLSLIVDDACVFGVHPFFPVTN